MAQAIHWIVRMGIPAPVPGPFRSDRRLLIPLAISIILIPKAETLAVFSGSEEGGFAEAGGALDFEEALFGGDAAGGGEAV